jgi:3-hydroxyacyl-[acyl-carrier-protein] dehydratase
MEIEQIRQRLPHRYPFLLIDRVVENWPGERLAALRNVTANEPWVPGHFPGEAIMPGVLIVEALAQACGLLISTTVEVRNGVSAADGPAIFYLAGVDKARFRRPVVPGDQLRLDVVLGRSIGSVWCFEGEASCDGRTVAAVSIRVTVASP